jgi:hypothetical protein
MVSDSFVYTYKYRRQKEKVNQNNYAYLTSRFPSNRRSLLPLSNVSRGKRQKEGSNDVIPCILNRQEDEEIFRLNWARLIPKIYEVDPLICPKSR